MKTLYDLFAHVLDTEDAMDDVVSRRRALRAATWGADQAQTRHRWPHYTTVETFHLSAPVEFDASIDANGLVTLDAEQDALPSWTDLGSIQVLEQTFLVTRRISDTQLQLEGWGLGVIAAGKLLRLVADRISLDPLVREVFEVRNETTDCELRSVTASQLRYMQHVENNTTSDPIAVTTQRVFTPTGRRLELRLVPAPATQSHISVSFYRRPRTVSLLHRCGTITSPDSSSVVTMTNPVQVRDARGLVLLVSSGQQEPLPDLGFGMDEESAVIDATYYVKSVDSTTTLTLETDPGNVSHKGAILTQELDLPDYAYNAAMRYAEAEFRRVGRGETGEYWQSIQMADRELRLAMEQESTLQIHQHPMPRPAIYTYPENLVGQTPS